MPKFFFHVHDDVDARDEDGAELPDIEAARLYALAGARSLAAEQVANGYLNLAHEIVVEDEAHTLLFRLPFGEAVDVQGFVGGGQHWCGPHRRDRWRAPIAAASA